MGSHQINNTAHSCTSHFLSLPLPVIASKTHRRLDNLTSLAHAQEACIVRAKVVLGDNQVQFNFLDVTAELRMRGSEGKISGS
jgi:hypothetical protein